MIPFPATTDGLDTSDTFAFTTENELQYYPDITGNSVDECSIDYVCGKYTYFDNFTVTTDSSLGVLKQFELRPNQFLRSPVSGLYVGSAVGLLAHSFRYWRGNIRLRLKFAKTKLHSGRIAVVYYPSGENPTLPVDYARYVQQEIIDLSKGSVWTIEFKYASSDSYIYTDDHYGNVYLVLMSKLVAPDVCSNGINIMMEASLAPGAEFWGPRLVTCAAQDAVIPAKTSVPASALPSAYKLRPDMSMPNIVEKTSAPSDVDPCEVREKVMLGNSQGDHIQYDTAAGCIGERITSLRQLIRRPAKSAAIDSGTTDVAWNPWLIKGSSATAPATTSYTSDWLDVIRPLYAYDRGGMIVRDISTAVDLPHYMLLGEVTNRLSVSPSYSTNFQPVIQSSGRIFQAHLPAWSPNVLNSIQYDGDAGDFSSTRATYVIIDRTSNASIETLYRIPRDDYSLHCYIGVPPVLLSNLSAGLSDKRMDRLPPARHGGAVLTAVKGKGPDVRYIEIPNYKK